MEPTAPRVVIVAAIDRTAAGDACVNTATSLARTIPGAELHLLHVISPPPDVTLPALTPLPAQLIEEGRAFLDGAAKTIGEIFLGRLAEHLAVGEPAHEILQLATDLHADYVVVGTHGKKALERVLVGSVSHRVVAKARCTVLVARAKGYPQSDVPEIEPPCPKCLETQRATAGARLWCEQHAGRHAHGRVHYELPKAFGTGSMFLRPEQ